MTAVPRSVLSLLALVLAAQPATSGASRFDDRTDGPRQGAAVSEKTPELRILAPAEGTVIVGATAVKATVQPPHLASRVVFFVDGLETCTTLKPPFECEWDAGPIVTEHQIRVVATLNDGTRLVRTTRTRAIALTERVDVDVVQVTVTVMDGDGRYARRIPQSAFHVSEDGRPQAVSHFYSENVPLDLVVAVDTSGSMSPALPALKQAVGWFLGAVPPRDRVTLIGFNDGVFPLSRNQTDPAERMKAVDRLTSWGSTVLHDAILEGARMLGTRSGRKALVVFTDGDDQGSFATMADVERELQASDLTLYMIAQGRGMTSRPLQEAMERLARATGGRAFYPERIDQLRNAFTELLEELSSQYVLGYQPASSLGGDGWRQIAVTVDGHPKVRARQGYRIRRSPDLADATKTSRN